MYGKDQTRYNLYTMTRMYSGSGDDGFTNLLGNERIPKHAMQPEAYGSVDEACAMIGLARALVRSEELDRLLLEIQGDLHDLMAELAASQNASDRFRKLDEKRIRQLERWIERFGQSVSMQKGFVFSGDSIRGAIFHLARTTVRRAERAVVRLHFEGEMKYPYPLQYLNRLSSLLFVLAVFEDQQAEAGNQSLTKDDLG